MKLYKSATWHNPFSVDVNGKSYVIDDIRVFDGSGVIASTGRGWFGNNNRLDALEIDCECVRKMKCDYSLKTAFIVKTNDSYESRYVLYIPDMVVKLTKPDYRPYNIIGWVAVRRVSTIYNEMVFEKVVNCDDKLQQSVKKINTLGEKFKILGTYVDTDTVTQMYKDLTDAIVDYCNERDTLKGMSSEEMLAYAGKGIV